MNMRTSPAALVVAINTIEVIATSTTRAKARAGAFA
jgi:hypothetical protein